MLVILLPGLLLSLLYWVAPQRTIIPKAFITTQDYLPYIIILPSLVLCFAFRLTREFNQLLILLIIYWVLFHFIWHNPYKVPINKSFLVYTLAILLPANIIWHNILKERGIISPHGLKRLGGTVLQVILLMMIFWFGNKTLHQALNVTLFSFLKFKEIDIPPLALFLFIVSGIVISVKTALKPSTLNINQFIFIAACLLLLQYSRNELYGSLFLSLAALSILITILLNSYSLAFLDELTGLPSRRALKNELAMLGKHYSVAMLDIDHFKKLNDTYGHDVGDQILRMVASRIRSVPGARKTFRYGGEEFTVLFPNKTSSEALTNAKSICEAIAKSPFVLRGNRRVKKKAPYVTKRRATKKIDVTISIGVAQRNSRHKNAQDTVKAADKALYRAKDAGRNRACT